MKKILALVSFVVLASACTSEPPTNAAKTNANTGETKSTAGISEADVTAKEKGVWDALKKKDYEAFSNMLAADYIEVEDDGVYDKAATSNTIKDFAISDATFSDWKIIPINKDAILVTYNLSLVNATYKTIAVPPGPYRVASAWVNRDGKWLEGFYQETLAKTGPPPTSTTAASPAASSAASPTAEPITSSDPAANEKLLWDAIKSKNAEAFAAFLAPDAVEVEPAGVYDKTASAKGITMFDASRTSLSDWKTAKLDTDATLVTYLMTTPGMKPDKERHSTIWVNRNGKWMALFHQGTPVAPPAKPAAK
jgi:hypothetical protein